MSELEASPEGYLSAAEAVSQFGFNMYQLKSLVAAGVLRITQVSSKRIGKVVFYRTEDLQRLAEGPRDADDDLDDTDSDLRREMKTISASYARLLELAMKQTQQAQDHEVKLVSAFAGPLKTLAESNQNQVEAVLEQNKQLVERANAGDMARLEFVKAAEGMLRDQRVELREQAELDRKNELRHEMWGEAKKVLPELMKGLKATTGADRIEAAQELAKKIDKGKLAAIVKFQLLSEEELGLMCKALDIDRAELDKLNAEADAAEAAGATTEEPVQ